jgi:hypothetical protein
VKATSLPLEGLVPEEARPDHIVEFRKREMERRSDSHSQLGEVVHPERH